MSGSTDSPRSDRHRNLCRRRQVCLAWLAAGCILLGWLLFAQPARYELVARIAVDDVLLMPSHTGFLVREGHGTFTLYGWDSVRRWSVDPPEARYRRGGRSRGYWRPGTASAYSLSPDGRMLAAATAWEGALRVQTWREGRMVGDLLLPLSGTWEGFHIRVVDSGRLFCWYMLEDNVSDDVTQALVIEGDEIIARGTFLPRSLIAPDGSAILSRHSMTEQTFARIRIQDGVIELTDQQRIPYSMGKLMRASGFVLDSALFANSTIMTAQGAVYNHGGRVAAPSPWLHQGMTPDGRATLQYIETGARVFFPSSGAAWTIPVSGVVKGGDVAMDQRHALVWMRNEPPPMLETALGDLPFMAQLADDGTGEYLALYRYPGRRIAIWRPLPALWWPEVGQVQERWWFPSPDGRAIAMTMRDQNTAYGFLFRYRSMSDRLLGIR